MSQPMNVGIYLFENMTMLDAYAPLQVLSFPEEFETFTFANAADPLLCDSGVMLQPQYGLDDCPPLDIIVMPGGGDVLPPMRSPELMAFLRERGPKAKYVTSVCSGALILAEAGLVARRSGALSPAGWRDRARPRTRAETRHRRSGADAAAAPQRDARRTPADPDALIKPSAPGPPKRHPTP